MGTKVASIYAEIGADTSKLEAGLKKTKTELQGTTKEAGLTGLGMAKLAIGGLVAIGAVDKLVGAVKFSIDAFAESERIMAQTEAVIRSTGGAAGMTAESIGDLANAEAALTGIDDEVVQSGANMLLTFQSIGKDVFPQAMRAVEDMAVAMAGGDASMVDLKGTAIQVGKALEDPINGVTALRRVGVMLTDEQIELVKSFMDVGDKASAQKVILGELNKEFGGSAEMAGSTLSGAFNKLEIASGNLAESLGENLAPGAMKAATALTYLMDRQTSLMQIQNMLSYAQEQELINDTEHMKLVQMTYTGDEGLAKVKQILTDKINAQAKATEANNQADESRFVVTAKLTAAYKEVVPVIKSAQVESYQLGQIVKANTELWQGSSKAYYDAYYATKKIDDATAALTQRMEDYRTVLAGALDSEQKNFVERQSALAPKISETKEKIEKLTASIADLEKRSILTPAQAEQLDGWEQKLANLEKRKYLTDDQKEQLGALKEKIAGLAGYKYLTDAQKQELEETKKLLGELTGELDANAKAHEESTKRILLSMIEQKLAVGGLTDDEITIIQSLMTKWGLAGEATQEAVDMMAKAQADYAKSGDKAAFIAAMQEALDLILKIKENSAITVKTT